jgi:hypothetical protein
VQDLQGLFRQIPYATEQGISKAEQGILWADQGTFRMEQGNSLLERSPQFQFRILRRFCKPPYPRKPRLSIKQRAPNFNQQEWSAQLFDKS